jgi:AraC family transcriptional regulator
MASSSDLWRLFPTINYHAYWKEKSEFLYPRDSYDSWIVFAVEAGSFQYEIHEHSGVASHGDLIVCPPNMEFARAMVTPLTFHVIRFDWNEADLAKSVPVGKITLTDHKRLNSNYTYLRQFLDPNDAHSRHWKDHVFHDLWQMYWIEQQQYKISVNSMEDDLMREAIALIEERAFGPLHLEQIAAECKLSPVQFTRKFRAVWNMTPSECLRKIRLQKAKLLLIETNWTIDHIAVQCGFDNGFYFSRVFSQSTRMSPSHYRRTHRV